MIVDGVLGIEKICTGYWIVTKFTVLCIVIKFYPEFTATRVHYKAIGAGMLTSSKAYLIIGTRPQLPECWPQYGKSNEKNSSFL